MIHLNPWNIIISKLMLIILLITICTGCNNKQNEYEKRFINVIKKANELYINTYINIINENKQSEISKEYYLNELNDMFQSSYEKEKNNFIYFSDMSFLDYFEMNITVLHDYYHQIGVIKYEIFQELKAAGLAVKRESCNYYDICINVIENM